MFEEAYALHLPAQHQLLQSLNSPFLEVGKGLTEQFALDDDFEDWPVSPIPSTRSIQ